MADVQIAVIDQQNTQIALAAPSETQVTVAVPGVQGPVGEGVPSGGTANQVLFKQSGTDYDTAWGEVTSAMIGDLEIVNADVAANAEIAVSKLADGAAHQLLQTDAAGTGVEWTDNVDVPGTLDVTGAATFDSSVAVIGALTKSGNDVVTVGDTGTVTSTMIADGTIVDADVNASAAIAGTKISPDFGAQNVTTTGTSTAASFIPTSSTVPTNGVYLPAANSVALSTNGTGRLFVDASGNVGFGVSSPERPIHLSDGGVLLLGTTAATGTQIAHSASSNLTINNKEAGAQIFYTSDTERLRITSAGLVGIGTSSPNANSQLHIVGSSYQPLYVNTTSIGGGGAAFFNSGTQALYVGTAGSTWLSNSSTADGLVRAEANLVLATNGNARAVTIDTSQRVGIGTTSPAKTLHVNGDIRLPTDYTISWGDDACRVFRATNDLRIDVGSSERARIDSSGRLLVGTNSASFASTAVFQGRSDGATNSALLRIAKGSSTPGSSDSLGIITFADSGTQAAAQIQVNRDGGTWASGSRTPGALLFFTAPDSASAAQERLRITSAGLVGIGTSSPGSQLSVSASGVNGLHLARQTDNGVNSGRLFFESSINIWTAYTTTGDFKIASGATIGTSSGTDRVVIDSSGRVGIGSTPSYKLDVNTDSNGAVNITDSITATLRLASAFPTTGRVYSVQSTGSDGGLRVFDQTAGTERARIDSSGRLLVGTSSDIGSARLVVRGNTTSGADGGILALANIYTASIGAAGAYAGQIKFTDSAGGEFGKIACQADGTNASGDYPGRLVFSTTADGASSPTERMRITSAGLVGIGTSSPEDTLQVGSDTNAHIAIANAGSTDVTSGINWRFGGAGTIYSKILSAAPGPGASYLSFYTTSSYTAAERMRIDGSGNVGIGTTSPEELLHLYDGAGGANQTIKFGNPAAVPYGSVKYSSGGSEFLDLTCAGTTAGYGNIRFFTGSTPSEAARIDSSGRLLVGTSSASGANGNTGLVVKSILNTNSPGEIILQNGYGNPLNAGAIGSLLFQDGTGDTYAQIKAEVDAQDGASGDFPGRLVFSTTADGASSPTERLRIDSSGLVGIGTTTADQKLVVAGNVTVGSDSTSGYSHLYFLSGTSGSARYGRISKNYDSPFDLRVTASNSTGAAPICFDTYSGNEVGRFDTSGRLLVGTSSAPTGSNTQYTKLGLFGNSLNSTASFLSLSYGTAATSLSTGIGIGRLFFGDTGAAEFASISCETDGSTGSGDYPGRLVFSTTADGASSPTERMRINNKGEIGIGAASLTNYRVYIHGFGATSSTAGLIIDNTTGAGIFSVRDDGEIFTGNSPASSPYNNTTATAANMVVTSGGILQRSTSSIKYKTNIETLQDSYADAILSIRPVWYQSTCKNDNPNWGYWGFIAEEVAEIDPRLVHWRTKTGQINQETGREEVISLETPEPEGVQYERFVPHLLNLIKRQQQAIETLEAKVAALETP